MEENKTMRTEIAEDICTLNRWGTPSKFKQALRRELTKDEIQVAMVILQVYVPHQEWIVEWNKKPANRRA